MPPLDRPVQTPLLPAPSILTDCTWQRSQPNGRERVQCRPGRDARAAEVGQGKATVRHQRGPQSKIAGHPDAVTNSAALPPATRCGVMPPPPPDIGRGRVDMKCRAIDTNRLTTTGWVLPRPFRRWSRILRNHLGLLANWFSNQPAEVYNSNESLVHLYKYAFTVITWVSIETCMETF